MYELPLFPLNTVLFPGQPLPLHIFEDRYKDMIGTCIDNQSPFGIVLLESGTAELDPTRTASTIKPYEIGCTAQITQVRRLAGGRLNITVVGVERFRIYQIHQDKSYLTGTVENLPVIEGDSKVVQRDAAFMQRWIERYLRVLENAQQIEPGIRQLPSDPRALAYLAAVLLHGISMEQKQQLLAAEALDTMLNALRDIYRREVVLLETMLSPPEEEFTGSFSLN